MIVYTRRGPPTPRKAKSVNGSGAAQADWGSFAGETRLRRSSSDHSAFDVIADARPAVHSHRCFTEIVHLVSHPPVRFKGHVHSTPVAAASICSCHANRNAGPLSSRCLGAAPAWPNPEPLSMASNIHLRHAHPCSDHHKRGRGNPRHKIQTLHPTFIHTHARANISASAKIRLFIRPASRLESYTHCVRPYLLGELSGGGTTS